MNLKEIFRKILFTMSNFFFPAPEAQKEKEEIKPEPIQHISPTSQKFMWIIDPGHSIHTPGKRSSDGEFLEYEFNRDIVRRMVPLLEKHGVPFLFSLDDYDAIKNDNTSLQERVKRINSFQEPVITISIHSNAQDTHGAPWGEATGIEVWYKQEDAFSRMLAATLQYNLLEALGWKDRGIKPSNRLYLLKKSKSPIVLSENGFFTNQLEKQALMLPEVRQKIAEAHVKTILKINE
jgi:N-acetylmuramoyl-L-alanine amidase